MNTETKGQAASADLGTWKPWAQLFCGLICMAMIANLQYGWTLFVDPINAKYHWGRTEIQIAFTLFVLTETWLVPVEAWFVDKFGPRVVVMFGGVTIALAWALNSVASELWMLYAGAILAGIGSGAVYGTCVGNALKWFPYRRGLAAGITAAGFGAGAALTVAPIARMIAHGGYEKAFLNFGIGQGAIVLLMALFISSPKVKFPAPKKKATHLQGTVDYTPSQMLKKPVFWLMYLMFVMVASGGLVAAAQIGPIAHDFKVADVPVSLFGVTMAALTFAISLDRIFDGFGRPFFGWVSDTIGRENTMFIAFGFAAIALTMLVLHGSNPIVFVIFSALFFLVFGEIYSLFPATSGDTFGSKFATTNNGLLYTAKGTAALLVPLASIVSAAYGWYAVFGISVVFNAVAALLALFVLKPMRTRFMLEGNAAAAGEKLAPVAAPAATPLPPSARPAMQ